MRVVLISTYELGRQPFGLASPAAWLREAGARVTCLDLAVQQMDEDTIRAASLVAFYLPMHTATRLAVPLIKHVRDLNPAAHLAAYGLYAPVNETYLRSQGIESIFGGEFESGLRALVESLRDGVASPFPAHNGDSISLARQHFKLPARDGLPDLAQYAQVAVGTERRITGYTEASRGCKHTCRHCPVVPVYEGQFRIVQAEVVLADIRQQVAAGAQHITFGDPDFFNGPRHALNIIEALHAEFPQLTYDATIKIEHLLKHRQHLATLRQTGCLFVTTAVESIDDHELALLDKGHTRADFSEVISLCRESGLILQPTFVTFTPWTTAESYRALLAFLMAHDLVEHVAPVQLAIRLLIPAGSKLLALPEVQALVGPFDAQRLVYPWRHPDPAMDRLQRDVLAIVEAHAGQSRRVVFERVAAHVGLSTEAPAPALNGMAPLPRRAPVPYLTEPWYC